MVLALEQLFNLSLLFDGLKHPVLLCQACPFKRQRALSLGNALESLDEALESLTKALIGLDKAV